MPGGASTQATHFWRERGDPADLAAVTPPEPVPATSPDTQLELSSSIEIVELPCVLDRFIEARPAVQHPSLRSPVVVLGEVDLAPLLRCVRGGMTSPELLRSWIPRVPPDKGLSIAHWLMARGLLVPHERGPMAHNRGQT